MGVPPTPSFETPHFTHIKIFKCTLDSPYQTFIITWILHQTFMFIDKVKLARAKITIPLSTPLTPSPATG